MIYYSILYPPILPISLPAFEYTQSRWKLYFEPSIGNKINDFKGGFVRIRHADSEISIFAGNVDTEFFYDSIPFRNPFAEYHDPLNSSMDRLQPDGFNQSMPFVDKDEQGYFVSLPTSYFNPQEGKVDKRFKVQLMFTSDWLSVDNEDGSGAAYIYDDVLGEYGVINKYSYFDGNLVEKGLSEWSRVTLIAPVSPANYTLIFDKSTETSQGYGVINSPIFEFTGRQELSTSENPNFLTAYKIDIYSVKERKKESLIDSSDWIVGQENPNLEIRWQNEIELDDKTDYIMELTIQTVWELRKTFSFNVTTSFAESLFQGKVAAINDHDKARTKIVISAKSPLSWGKKEDISINDAFYKYVKPKKDMSIEQGIDLTTVKGTFAGEMIVAGIEPIQHWKEDDSRFFFRMSGPELSHHNPYQEEYLMYAHSFPLGKESLTDLYEEDIIINPVLRAGKKGVVYETYMDVLGAITTMPTTRPPSHSFVLLRDEEDKAWKLTPTDNGSLITTRAWEYDAGSGEIEKPVYLYERHNQVMAKLQVDSSGLLSLGDKFYYKLGENIKPMYVNEFRLVKKVWGLQLGRKKLLNQQTYKAFMNDFNRKLGAWNKIEPQREYYIYFCAKGGQIYMYVRDIKASLLGKGENAIDRFNLKSAEISEMPASSMFIITEGINSEFLTIRDELTGAPIQYSISVDERGSLVSEKSFVGSSTSTHLRFVEPYEPKDSWEDQSTEVEKEQTENPPAPPPEVEIPPVVVPDPPEPTEQEPEPEPEPPIVPEYTRPKFKEVPIL